MSSPSFLYCSPDHIKEEASAIMPTLLLCTDLLIVAAATENDHNRKNDYPSTVVIVEDVAQAVVVHMLTYPFMADVVCPDDFSLCDLLTHYHIMHRRKKGYQITARSAGTLVKIKKGKQNAGSFLVTDILCLPLHDGI